MTDNDDDDDDNNVDVVDDGGNLAFDDAIVVSIDIYNLRMQKLIDSYKQSINSKSDKLTIIMFHSKQFSSFRVNNEKN